MSRLSPTKKQQQQEKDPESGQDIHHTEIDPILYHYLIEALNFAYSNRMALGDPAFVPDIDTIVQQMIR